MEAKRFFEAAIPGMILEHMDAFMGSQGCIAFSVHGEGQWTIFLGDMEEPVIDEFLPDADLRVWLSPKAFQDFASGQLDGAEALVNGDLVVAGQTQLFESLGYFLKPPSSLMDLYLGQ